MTQRLSAVVALFVTLSVPAVRATEPDGAAAAADGEAEPGVGGVFGLFFEKRSAAHRPPRRATSPAPPGAEAQEPAASPPTRAIPNPEEAPQAVSPGPAAAEPPPVAVPPKSPAAVPGAGLASHPPVEEGGGLGEPAAASSEVELPPAEIQGEIEKPEIFFLLPRARDRSDEQVIRARIRREITRPLIKDWLEEELLLR